MGKQHLPAEMVGRMALEAAREVTVRATNTEYPTSGLQQFGFAIIFFFPLLALIVVVLRIYSRFNTKQFGLDDALIIIAMMLSFGETATMFEYMKTNFVGIHAADIPLGYDATPGLIWNYVVQVLYNPILALVKTSMLLFLLRIGHQKPGLRWSIYVLNAFNLSLMVAIFLVVVFQCKPIKFNWRPKIEGGSCIHQGLFYVSTAALTIFTDILNLALPFWVFLDLKMHWRMKAALLFLFLLGGVVTVVGIVRLVFVYRAFFQKPGADPTYTLAFCTSAIETNLAIICASAPALRGLIRSWFPRFFSSGPSYDYNGYPTGSQGRRRHYGSQNPYGTGSTSTKITSRRKSANVSGGHSSTTNNNSTNSTTNNAYGESRRRKEGPSFALRDLKGPSRAHTEVNSHSPSASEEEIMTYNGIIRTTNVLVEYDQQSSHNGKGGGGASSSSEHGGHGSGGGGAISVDDRSRDRSRDRSSIGLRTSISGSL